VIIAPGHAEGSVTIPLGYGRASSAGGRHHGLQCVSAAHDRFAVLVLGARLRVTGKEYKLAAHSGTPRARGPWR